MKKQGFTEDMFIKIGKAEYETANTTDDINACLFSCRKYSSFEE